MGRAGKLAVLLLGAAAVFVAGVQVGQRQARPAQREPAVASRQDVPPAARPVAAAPALPARPAAARPPHPFPDVPQSRQGMVGETEPFGGDSPEEAEWLDRHGYPNARQWRRYVTATDLQLEQAAAAGDGVARTLLDARRLRTDPQAETRLLVAGADGNLFALNQLVAFKASRRDQMAEAYALSRVVEMRGDLMQSLSRPVMIFGLSDSERLLAEAEALSLNHQLNELYRQKYGVAPPPVQQRPYQVDEEG
ncbi:hypothetical protein [Stenotrophomonas sp.]|uniref:hypothetical protein n=1 Tax=Stenotrophomonas sp. TaxID=69392 RepID=UPI002FCAA9FB